MPYITEDRRKVLDRAINSLICETRVLEDGWKEGDLNYMLTRLCGAYIEAHGKRYSVMNAVVGVLECAKLELYRRLMMGYENVKILVNGDVPELDRLSEVRRVKLHD